MQNQSDSDIVRSWHRNADAWTRTVRRGLIESRRAVTNHAIVQAVLDIRPPSVLDMGCGEGWLVRALMAHGIQAEGVDAVPELITHARAAGGSFHAASYEDIIAAGSLCHTDAVVCNFSLLGKESADDLLSFLSTQMDESAWLIIQTVHPLLACGDHAYTDGWRLEQWDGFGGEFPTAAPWYFRTLGSWVALLHASGWRTCEMREPLHPVTGRPASAIFIAQTARRAR